MVIAQPNFVPDNKGVILVAFPLCTAVGGVHFGNGKAAGVLVRRPIYTLAGVVLFRRLA